MAVFFRWVPWGCCSLQLLRFTVCICWCNAVPSFVKGKKAFQSRILPPLTQFLGPVFCLGQLFLGHVVRVAPGHSSRTRHRNKFTVKSREKAWQEKSKYQVMALSILRTRSKFYISYWWCKQVFTINTCSHVCWKQSCQASFCHPSLHSKCSRPLGSINTVLYVLYWRRSGNLQAATNWQIKLPSVDLL